MMEERPIDAEAKLERLTSANILRKLENSEMGTSWIVELFKVIKDDMESGNERKVQKAYKLLALVMGFIKMLEGNTPSDAKGASSVKSKTPEEIMAAFRKVGKK